jgi:hypothetical protein
MELNDAHLSVKLVSADPARRVRCTNGDGSGVATVAATCLVAGGLS